MHIGFRYIVHVLNFLWVSTYMCNGVDMFVQTLPLKPRFTVDLQCDAFKASSYTIRLDITYPCKYLYIPTPH